MSDCFDSPCGNPCPDPCPKCPINTNDVDYFGDNEPCLNIAMPMTLTDVLKKIFNKLKNNIGIVNSSSLVVTNPVNNCEKVARIEVVPSTDTGNIFTLGSDNFPYVAAQGPGPTNVCGALPGIFSTDVAQNNTKNQTTYEFMALDSIATGCQAIKISPPTGFAVTGNTRKSAFGAVEWFDTLTLANNAAISGETVLIYNNTTENLILKDGVNYHGVGVHKINNLSTTGLSNCKLSNLIIVGTVVTNSNSSTISCSNVEIQGTSSISCKWVGGIFKNTIDIGSGGEISYFYSYSTINMGGGECSISNFIINDIGPLNGSGLSGGSAIYLNLGDPGKGVITNGYIKSINNSGLQVLTGGSMSESYISNLTIRTNTVTGLYIHGGPVGNGANSKNNISNINVSNNGPAAATVIVQTSTNGNSNYIDDTDFQVSTITSYSNTGAGIYILGANIRGCYAFSRDNYGIHIAGSEQHQVRVAITDCVGESINLNGIYASKNIFICGGTYKSWLDTSAGNPIKISNYVGIVQDKYIIAGVKTIAKNALAHAIVSTNAVNVRISGCQFLNPFVAFNTTILGIYDTVAGGNITLEAVSMDPYGNIG